MAVEQLAATDGTQHWVNAVIHYIMRTDWWQRVTLQKTHEYSLWLVINRNFHSQLSRVNR